MAYDRSYGESQRGSNENRQITQSTPFTTGSKPNIGSSAGRRSVQPKPIASPDRPFSKESRSSEQTVVYLLLAVILGVIIGYVAALSILNAKPGKRSPFPIPKVLLYSNPNDWCPREASLANVHPKQHKGWFIWPFWTNLTAFWKDKNNSELRVTIAFSLDKFFNASDNNTICVFVTATVNGIITCLIKTNDGFFVAKMPTKSMIYMEDTITEQVAYYGLGVHRTKSLIRINDVQGLVVSSKSDGAVLYDPELYKPESGRIQPSAGVSAFAYIFTRTVVKWQDSIKKFKVSCVVKRGNLKMCWKGPGGDASHFNPFQAVVKCK